MSTRGFIGFVVDGTAKIAYNHYDSYPGGLGVDMLDWLRTVTGDLDATREAARSLRVVTDGDQPSEEDIERLSSYANRGVSSGDLKEWYVLLYHTRGNPGAILRAGVLESASNFPADSLWAEWGYVVDFDANTFEAYRGFQQAPHDLGRFANMERPEDASDSYYPVALAASWPLDGLPSNEAFTGKLEPSDEEDE